MGRLDLSSPTDLAVVFFLTFPAKYWSHCVGTAVGTVHPMMYFGSHFHMISTLLSALFLLYTYFHFMSYCSGNNSTYVSCQQGPYACVKHSFCQHQEGLYGWSFLARAAENLAYIPKWWNEKFSGLKGLKIRVFLSDQGWLSEIIRTVQDCHYFHTSICPSQQKDLYEVFLPLQYLPVSTIPKTVYSRISVVTG